MSQQGSTEKDKTPKRGGFRRACDSCRKKKTKCEWVGKACEQCIEFDIECKILPIKSNKGPRRPPGHKRIAQLEERLKIAEAMSTTLAAIPPVPTNSNDSPTIVRDKITAGIMGFDASLGPNPIRISQERNLENHKLSSSTINNVQDYETSERELITTDWKTNVINDVFPRKTIKRLPPQWEAIPLMQEAFRNFNAAFPIFDPVRFFQRAQEEYIQEIGDDAAWWACLNVVLALAHRFRAMRMPFQQQENWLAWNYMQNALSVVAELSMMSSTLSTVQAMLGMAIILQGTPNPRPCAFLIATTIKLAQTMGLHRNEFLPHLTPAEIEERKRVFWIAYSMDKDISLRAGQPPTHDDDEMDVDLPTETISQIDEGPSFLNARINLALIQGQIYKRLCSIRAKRQSLTQRLAAAQELDYILKDWLEGMPVNFQDELSGLAGASHSLSTIIHTLIIRFQYFNCLYTIHQIYEDASYNQNLLQPQDTQEPYFIREARNAIKIVRMVPLGDYAYVWILLHCFVCATTSLLNNAIRYPGHIFAQSDIESIQPVIKLLKNLARNGTRAEIQAMYEMCENLERTAVNSMYKDAQRHDYIGRSGIRSNESIDDFIQRIDAISSGQGDDIMLMYKA